MFSLACHPPSWIKTESVSPPGMGIDRQTDTQSDQSQSVFSQVDPFLFYQTSPCHCICILISVLLQIYKTRANEYLISKESFVFLLSPSLSQFLELSSFDCQIDRRKKYKKTGNALKLKIIGRKCEFWLNYVGPFKHINRHLIDSPRSAWSPSRRFMSI